jgi:hypothetical protein
MANPPLTPYAVAGFTNHADLDPSEAMRDLGWQPRGVRAGLAACLRPTLTVGTHREPSAGEPSDLDAGTSTETVTNAAAPSAHGRTA